MSILPIPAGRRHDLACLGRLAVDLYAQQVGAPLEDVSSFAKYLGGSSANIAFGVARLGLRAAMVSRVGDEQMGRFLTETLAREGCDVSQVQVDPQRLTGLVLLGLKDRDTFPLLFYRENCADMALDADADRRGIHRRVPRAADHRHPSECTPPFGPPRSTALEYAPPPGAARARHRLPPGVVGPDQTRRRREPLCRQTRT
jgi:sugar/nucleoside kinase (ribokinase family)